MLSKQQFKRMTIVLVAPLLILGWWLASSEALFPRHHVILCEEQTTHISCVTVSSTKERAESQLWGNGAVRLWKARLLTGFNHTIVTQPPSELKIIDGQTVVTPSTEGGIKKILRLPPTLTRDNTYASCELSPVLNSDKEWGTSCIGYETHPEGFRFLDEQDNEKFQKALAEIGTHAAANESMEFRSMVFLLLAPLLAYFALAAVLFLLARLVKYVTYGRRLA